MKQLTYISKYIIEVRNIFIISFTKYPHLKQLFYNVIQHG